MTESTDPEYRDSSIDRKRQTLNYTDLLFAIYFLETVKVAPEGWEHVFRTWLAESGHSQSQAPTLERALLAANLLSEKDQHTIHHCVQDHLEQMEDETIVTVESMLTFDSEIIEALESADDEDLKRTLLALTSHESMTNAALGEQSTLARFKIDRLHRQGGLGEVFIAEDLELDRLVALKKIKGRYESLEESHRRFLREARITAKLEHPNIVPVYGLGLTSLGRPFYAMKLVRGESLRDRIRAFHTKSHDDSPSTQRKSAHTQSNSQSSEEVTESNEGENTATVSFHNPAEHPSTNTKQSNEESNAQQAPNGVTSRPMQMHELLNTFVSVCQAIEFAHSRNIIHRDIKPANIMIGQYGETLVVDWGLARDLGVDSSFNDSGTSESALQSYDEQMTSVGQPLGTLPYASPEQVRGDIYAVNQQSDIYSLGATLYMILTGEAPYSGNREALIKSVQAGDFDRPSTKAPGTPKPLDAICAKAMAKRPEDRYPSCKHLADDVSRWLADEPVTAYRESVFERSRRWLSQHQTLATTLSVALVIGAFGLLAAYLFEANRRFQLGQLNGELTNSNIQLQTNNEATLSYLKLAADTGHSRLTLEAIDDALRTEGIRNQYGTELEIMRVKASYGDLSSTAYAEEAKKLFDSGDFGRYEAEITLMHGDGLQVIDQNEQAALLIQRALDLNEVAIAKPTDEISELPLHPKPLRPEDVHYAEALLASSTPACIALLKQAIDVNPYHLRARHRLIANLLLLGERVEALEQINRGRSVYPQDTTLSFMAAWAYAFNGDRIDVQRVLDELRPVAKDSEVGIMSDLFAEISKVANIMDRWDGGTQISETWTIGGILTRVRFLHEGFSTDRKSTIRFNPSHAAYQAYSELLKLLVNEVFNGTFDLEKAEGLDDQLQRHPDGLLHFLVGLIYMHHGLYEKALASFEHAESLSSVFPNVDREATYCVAMLHAKIYVEGGMSDLDRVRMAAEAAERRVNMGPLRLVHFNQFIDICFRGEAFHIVELLTNSRLKQNRNDPIALFRLAQAQIELKKFALAIENCDRLLELDPDYPNTRAIRERAAEEMLAFHAANTVDETQ